MNSVLVDTSFCIRLMNAADQLHQNALDYYQYFLDNKIDIYLSTIVISEYAVKDDPLHLPLKTMKIITFDFSDAKTSGQFYSIIRQNNINNVERRVVINDCKILAQLYNRKIDGYLSKDKDSFNKIIAPIQKEHSWSIQLLDLEIPLNTFLGKLF